MAYSLGDRRGTAPKLSTVRVKNCLLQVTYRLLLPMLSGVSLCLIACQSRRQAAAIDIDDAARQYVRLAVALGERDRDSIDFYTGPPAWVDGTRRNPPSLDEI